MPCINGRLWDSKDRGAADFEFSRVALPAATKKEDGQPFLERYGSKETNGEPVSLAVMCPTTRLWQDRVRDIVLRLQRDEGVRGVYIDQIAAAAPTLCVDASHGHPLGGGHWWTEGYWELLKGIRREMPADRMLTTECNGEPFIRWFDGYLTWHWQHDGQVPAFPAVYGGTIQMFGRAYRGGATGLVDFRQRQRCHRAGRVPAGSPDLRPRCGNDSPHGEPRRWGIFAGRSFVDGLPWGNGVASAVRARLGTG